MYHPPRKIDAVVATTAAVTDENICDVLICNCDGDIVFLDIFILIFNNIFYKLAEQCQLSSESLRLDETAIK